MRIISFTLRTLYFDCKRQRFYAGQEGLEGLGTTKATPCRSRSETAVVVISSDRLRITRLVAIRHAAFRHQRNLALEIICFGKRGRHPPAPSTL